MLMPSRGLYRRGYTSFLYRFFMGFVEDDPDRPRKRKKKVRRGRKFRRRFVSRSPGPKFRIRVKTTPLGTSVQKAGEWWKFVNGTWIKHFDVTATLTSPYKSIWHTQDYTNPGPPYRTGSTFTSVKVDLNPTPVLGFGVRTTPTTVFVGGDGTFLRQYRGGFTAPNFSGVDWDDSQYASQTFLLGPVSGFVPSMAAYHGMVDARLRPKLSHANLGQSLAELREVPRMLETTAKDFRDYWKFVGGSGSSSRMSPKGASDSFLNAQFGWAPFIRDIFDVCDVIVNVDRYVQETSRKNNRWDHRETVLDEGSFEQIITTGTGSRVQPNSFLLDQLLNTSASWTKRYTFSKRESYRVWASGDFKFYRPEFDMSRSDYNSGLNQIRRLSTLLGTNISPSLLWNITPWTWLADWFGNAGKVIENLSAAALDGVVSKNVFLMYSYSRTLVLKQELNFLDRPISAEFYRIVNSKQRGHAKTPYGFSLLPTQLSGKQLSILGALGISKFS